MGRLTLTDVRRSTHTIMSRSLMKTTNWKGSDTRSSSYPRMSQYPPLRTVYGYLVRLVLPLIQTIIWIRSFSDIRATAYSDDEGEGKERPPLRVPTPPVPTETTSASNFDGGGG
jgi:hypothetical protein